jgi:geranylgeranyl diphosphate synthase type I
MMSLDVFKSWFDEKFLVLLENKYAEFLQHSNNAEVKIILTHLMVIAKEGKRLRPYMAYVGYTTEGGEHAVFEFYAAIELLHLFCLIHDDVMDNTAMRHNVNTIHTLFDIPTAILIGDIVLSWSFECLLAMEEIEPYTIDDCKKEYNIMLSEVIHGQLLDVLAAKNTVINKDSIESIMELKSARYSFYRPLVLGILLAGGEDSLDFAKAYAVNLVLHFNFKTTFMILKKTRKMTNVHYLPGISTPTLKHLQKKSGNTQGILLRNTKKRPRTPLWSITKTQIRSGKTLWTILV